jgi:hypothetical protein
MNLVGATRRGSSALHGMGGVRSPLRHDTIAGDREYSVSKVVAMAEKPDPLGAPNPDDPFWVPPNFPVFHDPAPMPIDPVAPPGKLLCAHCGTVLKARLGLHAPGDFAVCGHCNHVLIIMPNGHPRLPTYDELVAAESDPRVRMLQRDFQR